LPCFHNLYSQSRDDEELPTDATAIPSTSPTATDEPAEPTIAPRATRSSVKKVSQTQAKNLKRAKKTKAPDVSLKAHASTVSLDDVSNSFLYAFFAYTSSLTHSFPQTLMKRFIALGTECAGYLKVAKASKGIVLMSSHFSYALSFAYSSDFLSSSFVAALATANARIASLEAELNASQKAYDIAAAAKANAEKSQKAALGKTKKAEKALADANKGHAQREQAVAEHLHTMSSAAESKRFALSFLFSTSPALVC
jgi:hypothetical protein